MTENPEQACQHPNMRYSWNGQQTRYEGHCKLCGVLTWTSEPTPRQLRDTANGPWEEK